jgi:hypothetical protein
MAQVDATHPQRMEFRRIAALVAVGTLLAVAFGLRTLMTPLYLLYQKAFGFSQITLTLIYAATRSATSPRCCCSDASPIAPAGASLRSAGSRP